MNDSTVIEHKLSSGETIKLCIKCMIHVDDYGNPDPKWYSSQMFQQLSSVPIDERCPHKKGGKLQKEFPSNREIVNQLIQSIASRNIQNPYVDKIKILLEEATGLRQPEKTFTAPIVEYLGAEFFFIDQTVFVRLPGDEWESFWISDKIVSISSVSYGVLIFTRSGLQYSLTGGPRIIDMYLEEKHERNS